MLFGLNEASRNEPFVTFKINLVALGFIPAGRAYPMPLPVIKAGATNAASAGGII